MDIKTNQDTFTAIITQYREKKHKPLLSKATLGAILAQAAERKRVLWMQECSNAVAIRFKDNPRKDNE